jgi:hypothetical protein
MSRAAGCSSPWPTSSETVPADAKLGFSDNHGSGLLGAVGHPLVDVFPDGLVVDVDEGSGELPVVLDQAIPNPKDVHASTTATECDPERPSVPLGPRLGFAAAGMLR